MIIQDEELYQVFTPESNVEAVRVIRDPHTSLGKGFAFVLFKTKVNRINCEGDTDIFPKYLDIC